MSVRLCAAHRRRVLRRGAFALLSLVALAGLPAQADDPPVAAGAGAPAVVDGAQVYTQLCQACHMADGGGATGAGTYPSFRGNPNIASATFMAAVVLHGRRNMPSFAPT